MAYQQKLNELLTKRKIEDEHQIRKQRDKALVRLVLTELYEKLNKKN